TELAPGTDRFKAAGFVCGPRPSGYRTEPNVAPAARTDEHGPWKRMRPAGCTAIRRRFLAKGSLSRISQVEKAILGLSHSWRGPGMAKRQKSKPIHQMTVRDFERMFPDEEACRVYLAEHRWPEFVTCPRCGNPEVKPHARAFHWVCYA